MHFPHTASQRRHGIFVPPFPSYWIAKRQKIDVIFFYFYGSVLLVAPAFHRRPPPLDSFVCNPLRWTSSRLPAMSSITKVLAKGIVQGREAETYRVVVVGESPETGDGINGRRQIVEIYDSSQKSWRTAGHLQDNLVGNESWWHNPMVFGGDTHPCTFLSMHTH